jgi:hypothetical protein
VQVTLEHQAEACRKQDVAVLDTLAAIDEDFAGIEVDIDSPEDLLDLSSAIASPEAPAADVER